MPRTDTSRSTSEPPALGRTRREEQAHREIGVTEISRSAAWTALAVFLLLVCSVPVLELRRGLGADGGQAALSETRRIIRSVRTASEGGAVAANRALLREMNAFEDRLDEESLVARAALPEAQYVQTVLLRVGNQQVYLGRRDGDLEDRTPERPPWLYYRPALDSVTGSAFLDPGVMARREEGGESYETPPHADPRPAIRAFSEQLAARGIELVLLPVPVKASVHPEGLVGEGKAGRVRGVRNASTEALFDQLRREGIAIYDPLPEMLAAVPEARSAGGEELFLRTDSHWSPAGMDLTARGLARYLTNDLLSEGPADAYRAREEEVEGRGDLENLLRLPEEGSLLGDPFPPETACIRRVETRLGEPWAESGDRAGGGQSESEVLLLGDSFANVFSQPSLGWGEGAGLAETLSLHLGRPVDRIAVNAGGPSAARERLADLLAGGGGSQGGDPLDGGPLDGKEVVVWEFSERELAFGDWRPVPFGAPSAGLAPDSGAARGEPVPGWEGLGDLGRGFAVWESNRPSGSGGTGGGGGDWRIWTARLDGSGLRQLSPAEPGRQHCCASISPDGRRVVYLSRRVGKDRYPKVEEPGELRSIALDGSGETTLVAAARTYGWGNRAVVWRRAEEGSGAASGGDALIYVAGDGTTRLLDLSKGEPRPLTRSLTTEPREELGWLLSPDLTHATNAAPSFSLYDAESRSVLERSPLPGCEPYFSPDGRWGFWISGGGGPLKRMRLAGREESVLIARDDPRLPPDGRYLYFPMVSRDGRALAYGASDGEHDHFRADYEVYFVPVDPRTLELAGEPRRLTDHPATDRYPDVFPPPLELGWHFGEAPLRVDFPAPTAQGIAPNREVTWSFGEGPAETFPASVPGRHTYETPGRYPVTARVSAGGAQRVLRGEVVVVEASPPRALGAAVEEDGRTIRVRFDEAVDLSGVKASLTSGAPLRQVRPGGDGRSLVLVGERPVEGGEALRLAGVRDRSSRRLALAPVTLPIEPPPWPESREDLVFLWRSGDAENLVRDPERDELRSYPVTARGRGRLNRRHAMVLGAGASFKAAPEAARRWTEAAQASRAVSVAATLTPGDNPGGATDGFAPIVALGEGPGAMNLALGQEGRRLVLRLLTGPPGSRPPVKSAPLLELTPEETVSVVVTYSRGSLAVYRDGERILADDDLIGGAFARWQPRSLCFGAWCAEDKAGSEAGGGSAWEGVLEGIALYSRVLPPAEVAENHRRLELSRRLTAAEEAPRVRVRARLVASSRVPTLREISPYRQALAVFEYRVEEVLDTRPGGTGSGAGGGSPELAPGNLLRVARWVWLDAERQPAASAPQGSRAELVLEPYSAHPQLEAHTLSDTLPTRPGAGSPGVLYYAVEEP